MTTLTISSKGWVVISAEIRRKYGLTPGTKVRIVDYGGGFSIIPVMEDPITEAAGILKGPVSLAKALLEERAHEKKREDEA